MLEIPRQPFILPSEKKLRIETTLNAKPILCNDRIAIFSVSANKSGKLHRHKIEKYSKSGNIDKFTD